MTEGNGTHGIWGWLSWTTLRASAAVKRAAWLLVALAVLVTFRNGLAWSTTTLVLIIAFHDQVRALLAGLSGALSRSTKLEIEVGGQKLALTAAEASDLLQKIADDVKLMIKELTEDQKLLFVTLARNPEIRAVPIGDPPLSFKRNNDAPTQMHQDLRALRERHLIRPRGGGRWQPNKYPELTPFGELVAKSASLATVDAGNEWLKAYIARVGRA